MEVVASDALSDLVGVFRWDWEQFWAQFVASTIVFLVGIPAAFWLLRSEFRHQDKRSFEQFQNIAGAVRDDIRVLIRYVDECWREVEQGRVVRVRDPMPLTWDINADQLKFIFAQHGVWRDTERAMRYYREAVLGMGTLMSAASPGGSRASGAQAWLPIRLWKRPASGSRDRHDPPAHLALIVAASKSLLAEAAEQLEKAAKLDQYMPPSQI
jgi:hypothetical protein